MEKDTIGKKKFILLISLVFIACLFIMGCNASHVEEDYTGRNYYKVLPDNHLSTDSYIEFIDEDHLKLYNFEFDQSFIEWFSGSNVTLEDAVNVDLEYFTDSGKLFIHIYDIYAICLEIDGTGDLIYNNIVYRQNN